MKDAIGQEITVGDRVVHSPSTHAGMNIHTVSGIGPVCISCEPKRIGWGKSVFRPDTVCVVTDLLNALPIDA